MDGDAALVWKTPLVGKEACGDAVAGTGPAWGVIDAEGDPPLV